MSDLENQVLTSLRRIIRATYLHSRKLEKQSGLTTSQLIIIQAVNALRDPTVSAIAHAASLSLATVTTILNRLEKNGLVSRCRSVTDRRRVIVTLTDAGGRFVSELRGLCKTSLLTASTGCPRSSRIRSLRH